MIRLFSHLDKLIEQGDDAFQNYIRKAKQHDPAFLWRSYSTRQGGQWTILNYLISKHRPASGVDLRRPLTWLIQQGVDVNMGQPIHFLLQCKKFDLIPLFFQQDSDSDSEDDKESIRLAAPVIDFDARDREGQTLLSRVISSRNSELLRYIPKDSALIHEPNRILVKGKKMELQPIHQAVIANYPEVIKFLFTAGVKKNNPCGKLSESPILLACRFGNIASLKILLEQGDRKALLDATNIEVEPKRPIDFLCQRLRDKIKPEAALIGIAILLAHGAKPPRNKEFIDLLTAQRIALVTAVKTYTRKRPELAVGFVRACHNRHSVLHQIIYPQGIFSRLAQDFFGRVSSMVFLLESLVYDQAAENKSRSVENSNASHFLQGFDQDELHFAKFVGAYKDAIKDRFFFNRWSTMLGNLTSGQCTSMKAVSDYVDENPYTRSASLLNQP